MSKRITMMHYTNRRILYFIL